MAGQVSAPKKPRLSTPGNIPDFSLEMAAYEYRPDLFASSEKIVPEQIVIGLDEAGRGPWAGPVTAAAAYITPDHVQSLPEGLNDSKKLNAAKRQELFLALQKHQYVTTAVASSSVAVIDDGGILKATFNAMDDAVMALLHDHPQGLDVTVLVDGNLAPPFPRLHGFLAKPPIITPVIKGDSRSLSIAAASIMAKQTRDMVMADLHQDFPLYQWADNKGYGTAAHQSALAKHGLTPHHRRSFKPIQRLIKS